MKLLWAGCLFGAGYALGRPEGRAKLAELLQRPEVTQWQQQATSTASSAVKSGRQQLTQAPGRSRTPGRRSEPGRQPTAPAWSRVQRGPVVAVGYRRSPAAEPTLTPLPCPRPDRPRRQL